MSIQPSNDFVLIGDTPFSCESQPRRVCCLQVDSSKMQKILAKAARSKHTESELFLVYLHFARFCYFAHFATLQNIERTQVSIMPSQHM